MENNKNATVNKRPTFLSVWLILIIIVNVVNLLTYTLGYSSLVNHHGFMRWEVIGLAVISLIGLGGALLIWSWYKSGLYLIILGTIASIFVNPSLSRREFSVAYSIIGIAILYMAMRPAWRRFK